MAIQPAKVSHRPISTRKPKPICTSGIIFHRGGGGARVQSRRGQQRHAAHRQEPAEKGDQDCGKARPILVVCDDYNSSPPNKSRAPVIHTRASFWKNADAIVPMFGARTATMAGTMTRNGPMTRAKARVRALASGEAGMGALSLRRHNLGQFALRITSNSKAAESLVGTSCFSNRYVNGGHCCNGRIF